MSQSAHSSAPKTARKNRKPLQFFDLRLLDYRGYLDDIDTFSADWLDTETDAFANYTEAPQAWQRHVEGILQFRRELCQLIRQKTGASQ